MFASFPVQMLAEATGSDEYYYMDTVTLSFRQAAKCSLEHVIMSLAGIVICKTSFPASIYKQ